MSSLGDGQLLAEVAASGSQECFEELVRRHGAMVLGACRRLLDNAQDAEDAAQAVFLLLWKKAASLRGRTTVAGWLHQVARKVCGNARRAQVIRRKYEREAAEMSEQEHRSDDRWDEIKDLLDEELNRLPEKYRLLVILFHLEGRSLEEIAALLRTNRSTVGTRLSRARELLRSRLAKKGIGLTVATLAATLTANASAAAAPVTFVSTTTQAAALFAAGKLTAEGILSAKSAALAKGVSKMLLIAKLKVAAAVVAASTLAAGGAVALTEQDTSQVEELESSIAQWIDEAEFAATYKLYDGTATTLEDGLAGRIQGRQQYASGRISKKDDKLRFSEKLTRTPIAAMVNGSPAIPPDFFLDLVLDSDFRFAYQPGGEAGTLRIDEAPVEANSAYEFFDLNSGHVSPFSPALSGARFFFHPRFRQQDLRTRLEEIGDNTVVVHMEHGSGADGTKRTVEFWTKPDPPVVTRVTTDSYSPSLNLRLRHARVASDFVECGGSMIPRTVRLVGTDQHGRLVAAEWISEDLGTRPPMAEDFVLNIPANARVQGLRRLPEIHQASRSFDVEEFDRRDLGPIGTTPPPRIAGRTAWITTVVGLSLLLIVSCYVLLKRRSAGVA